MGWSLSGRTCNIVVAMFRLISSRIACLRAVIELAGGGKGEAARFLMNY